MLLLISDANILIDIDVGDLVQPAFGLGYQLVVSDVIYYEELEEQHAYLVGMGLQIHSLSSESVMRVQALSQTYSRPSRNDLFALALAEKLQCPLLTGDAALRRTAETEHINVKGTVWLITEMVRKQQISLVQARVALNSMQLNGRRLPWREAEQALMNLELETT